MVNRGSSKRIRFFDRYGKEVIPYYYKDPILKCITSRGSSSYHRSKVYIRGDKRFNGESIYDIEKKGYHLSISKNFRVSLVKNKGRVRVGR